MHCNKNYCMYHISLQNLQRKICTRCGQTEEMHNFPWNVPWCLDHNLRMILQTPTSQRMLRIRVRFNNSSWPTGQIHLALPNLLNKIDTPPTVMRIRLSFDDCSLPTGQIHLALQNLLNTLKRELTMVLLCFVIKISIGICDGKRRLQKMILLILVCVLKICVAKCVFNFVLPQCKFSNCQRDFDVT